MRRSPIFSIGQVVQKSRPVSSCTFSSRVSCRASAVVRAASSRVVSVIEITFRSSGVGLEDADVPGAELERRAGASSSSVRRSRSGAGAETVCGSQPQLCSTCRRPLGRRSRSHGDRGGSCQPPTGSGTSQRARLSASAWSGTVPTTVIRPAPTARGRHRGPAAQVRVDVAGQDLGTVGLEQLGDEGGRTGERFAAHRYGVGEVGHLVVPDAGRLAQHRRAAAPRAAGPPGRRTPSAGRARGDRRSRRRPPGSPGRRRRRCRARRRPARGSARPPPRPTAHRRATAAAAADGPGAAGAWRRRRRARRRRRSGGRRRGRRTGRARRTAPASPGRACCRSRRGPRRRSRARRPRRRRRRGASSSPSDGELAVGATGLAAVRQHAAPVGLGAEGEGVPVPVGDHPGAAGDQQPGGLPPLAVVRRLVHRREADRAGVGLGDQERRLARGLHQVGQVGHRPRPADDPAHRAARTSAGRWGARASPPSRSRRCRRRGRAARTGRRPRCRAVRRRCRWSRTATAPVPTSSRTMSACQPMKSVTSSVWKRRQARSYCGWKLPSGRHRSAQVESRCDQ